MDIKTIYDAVSRKAVEDGSFRQRLLRDPKGAVGEAAGIIIPDSVQVTIHESTPSELKFVLQQKLTADNVELTDAELDQVAGGDKTDVIYADTVTFLRPY